MFQWLVQWFSQRRDRLREVVPHLEAVAVHNQFMSMPDLMPQTRVYEQSPWVHVAINRIAEAGALVPLRVLQVQGEDRLEVENHPLEQLLNQPNPTMSRFELFEQTLGFLELMGNAYWFLAGDAHGRPREIWVLRPDRVTIVPDAEQYVRGYLYEINGQHIPLDAVEVVHFKRWHPNNDYYGLPAISAARLAVSSDRAMAEWNHNTFGKDKGVPAGMINIKEFVTDTDFARIKREWNSSYGGVQRKTAFLRGGDIEWRNVGLNHTDADFLKGREAHRNEILNIFGIPVGLVSENATEANAKVAERQFIERTLYPKLVRLAQKITQELLPFYAGESVAVFDDIRPTDTHARLEEIRVAQSVMSINEIRQRFFQLPAVVWGDLPVGMSPVEPMTPQLEVGDAEPAEETSTKTAMDELTQWERFALKRVGKSGGRAFTVHEIPDDVAFEVSARLLTCADKESVKALFAEVKDMLTLDPAVV